MKLLTIIVLLSAHFIGDFVMQTDQMAKGKSGDNRWLTTHVVTYSIFLWGIVFSYDFLSNVWVESVYGRPLDRLFIGMIMLSTGRYVLLNSIAHWITDYFTSRWTTRLWKQGKVHEFFVVIGLDQLMHYVVLFGLAWRVGI